MDFEFAILDFIQRYCRSDIMDKIMLTFTRLGDAGAIWIVLAIGLVLYPRTRKVGAVMIVALLIDALLCNVILKPWIGRIRPYDVRELGNMLLERQHDYSFPSGHTAAAFTCVAVLYMMRKKKLFIASLILAVIIAFSRLYLYVHYPTDVLAGVLLGVICAALGYAFINAAGSRLSKENMN